MSEEERRALTEVRDRPAELWIKVLSLVAVITLPLIGVIGKSLIDGQNRMTEEISKMNAFLQTHESRISRNEDDIKEINVKVNGNSERIYKLKGAK